MNEIKVLDAVALTCVQPRHGLLRGDVGTAALVQDNGAAFEMESVGCDGHTVALLTLERDQVRPLRVRDIPYARDRDLGDLVESIGQLLEQPLTESIFGVGLSQFNRTLSRSATPHGGQQFPDETRFVGLGDGLRLLLHRRAKCLPIPFQFLRRMTESSLDRIRGEASEPLPDDSVRS